MMGYRYVLEGGDESARLDYQDSHPDYDVKYDLEPKDLFAFSGMKVLDAGCGNADYCRMLIKNNPLPVFQVDAVDQSKDRLKEAKKRADKERMLNRINFKQQWLEKLDAKDNYYHRVLSRFTFHHFHGTHQKVADEFYRVLKPGFELIVIDSAGVMLDIFSQNKEHQKLIDILKAKLPLDLYVGHKLEGILSRSGFRDIKVRTRDMRFPTMIDREFEVQMYEDRFLKVKDIIADTLKSEADANRFIELTYEAIRDPRTIMCYKKYFLKAIK